MTKVAIVIGGSRGIGAVIVRRLAAQGMQVHFTYKQSVAAAESLQREIELAGGTAVAHALDVREVPSILDVTQAIANQAGRLDVMVCSAGVGGPSPVDRCTQADFDPMFEVNVRGVFFSIQAAVRHMSRGGRIVTIGSAAAQRPLFAGNAVYSATKGAVATMVKALALDLAPLGITINNVQPGPTATERTPTQGPMVDFIKQTVPLKRFAQADEVAALAAYLVSDEAAYMSGSSLTLDGALTA
jgi:3-oxoacyl-[acyl-carrier protein] reductase